MNSKYSVLMSLYNGEKEEYLSQSIESMLSQSTAPDEIVIVLDGPINKKLDDIISDYDFKFPGMFSIVPLKENVGLGEALNEGLKKCKNNLVARMDTDDIALRERCEKQLRAFSADESLSIVGTNVDEFSIDPQVSHSSRIVPSSYDDIIKFSKKRNPFNHPSVMYKKDAVIAAGGYGNFRRNQDYDLFMRMLYKGYKAVNLDQSLLLFRANESNLKRRKSWTKTKGDILLRINFFKLHYISLLDMLFSVTVLTAVFLMPSKIFKWFTSNFLRVKSEG